MEGVLMKEAKLLILGVLSVLMVVVAVSGCTSNTNTQTFNGQGISFQYPSDWQQFTPNNTDASEVVHLQITEGTSILGVFVKSDDGLNLELQKEAMLMGISRNNNVISINKINIAGGSGYRIDTSYEKGNGSKGYHTHIFFVKNGKFYLLLFTTDSLSAIESDINTIVNSFQTT